MVIHSLLPASLSNSFHDEHYCVLSRSAGTPRSKVFIEHHVGHAWGPLMEQQTTRPQLKARRTHTTQFACSPCPKDELNTECGPNVFRCTEAGRYGDVVGVQSGGHARDQCCTIIRVPDLISMASSHCAAPVKSHQSTCRLASDTTHMLCRQMGCGPSGKGTSKTVKV